MKSIRTALIGTLLATVAGLLLVTGVVSYLAFDEQLDDIFDAELSQIADTAPLLADGPSRQVNAPARMNSAIAIWKPGAAVPIYVTPVRVALPRDAPPGLSTVYADGARWRVFSTVIRGDIVQVAEPLAARHQAAAQVAWRLGVAMLVVLCAATMTVWVLIGRGLRPLSNFATEVRRRSPRSLLALSVEDTARELAPIAAELNGLLARLAGALSAQQTFVGDAAHELLTPLTAVQVQLQVLERARTEERRAQALDDVRRAVDRCIALARQLLVLERQAPDAPHPPFAPVVLGDVVRFVVEDSLRAARERSIDVGVVLDAPTTVEGDTEALRLMLRNLVDNAIKYSPAGSRVDVVAGRDGQHPFLIVRDAGPGIAEESRQRVFDRFYRDAAVDVDGSGLGLAIVREIAARHGATIELRSPGELGGLDVITRFRASAQTLCSADQRSAAGSTAIASGSAGSASSSASAG